MVMWDLTVEVGKHDRRTNVRPEETARLHGRLDEWYARTPRPIGRPTLSGDSPEDEQKTLFDQYYYMLVATLYRPRSLANPPLEQIKMLHKATSTALSICAKIQAQGKLFDVGGTSATTWRLTRRTTTNSTPSSVLGELYCVHFYSTEVTPRMLMTRNGVQTPSRRLEVSNPS